MKDQPRTPLIVVISGPSGVGKDALLAKMKEMKDDCHFVVTATTRKRRPGEINGRNHIFVSREEFFQMMRRDELLEWAQVYGNYYGVPRDQVRSALEQGKDVILRTDLQGAETIRSKVPDALLIFVAPPTLEDLERRLRARMTESSADLEMRIEMARREMNERGKFDYVVVNRNGRLDDALEEMMSIISSEKKGRA